MTITIEDLELNVQSLINKEGFSKDIFSRFNHLLGEVWETSKEVNDLLNAEDPMSAEEIRKKLGKELYDVIWNAIALAQVAKVDIGKAIKSKISENTKRFNTPVTHSRKANSYGFLLDNTICGLKLKEKGKVKSSSFDHNISCINCLKIMRIK